MRIPLLDVLRQHAPLEEELRDAFDRVLRSGQYILGPEVERFEAAAASVSGTRFAVGLSSGTDAILVALMALGIGPGDEVICPSFTFFATGGCVARVGARPVFADSCPNDFNIDPAGIEPLITPRTKAIIPVHLFGQPADMDPILDIAGRYGLRVIEDTAQAYGAEYRGRRAGSMGDVGTISFYPTKNLGAFGDAGLLVTNDAALADRARLLRNHGAEEQYVHRTVGGNFRLDAVQAALLAVKLPRLAEYTAARQRHFREYNRALADLPRSAAKIVVPVAHGDRSHIANQYTLRVSATGAWKPSESPRDALRNFLRGKGIASAIYYPIPLHRQECFTEAGRPVLLPVAEMLASEAVSLPVFAEMTDAEREIVIGAVRQFMASRV